MMIHVFVLLMHYYHARHVHSTVIMESTSPHRVSVNIGKTVKKHRATVPNLIAVHTLTGCDVIGENLAIGKVKAVKVL